MEVKDIQFLAVDDVATVPFKVTGSCTGRRSLAQKAIVLLFDPEVGQLEFSKFVSSPTADTQLRVAISQINNFLIANYGDVKVSVSDISKDRSGMNASLLLTTPEGKEPINITGLQ